MEHNIQKIRARIKSIAKALSEKLGVSVSLNDDGTNNTDTMNSINIADPNYYIETYGALNEESLLALCMYSGIHEAGHIAHTDVYNGKKIRGHAIEYVLKKEPQFKPAEAFKLLNILEDYRMMHQLASHRVGVLKYMQRADRVVGSSNLRYVENTGRNVDAISMLLVKLFSPEYADKMLDFAKRKDMTRIDKLVDELKAIDFKTSTTLDVAELVLKYYTAFFVRNKPEDSITNNEPSTKSSKSSEPSNDEEESESDDEESNEDESNDEESDNGDSNKPDDDGTRTTNSKDNTLDSVVESLLSSDDNRSETEKLTDHLRTKKAVNIRNTNLDKDVMSRFLSSELTTRDDLKITKFSELLPKEFVDLNCNSLHNNVPSVYVEPKVKTDEFRHFHYTYDSNIKKDSKKLASKLEYLMRLAQEEVISGTKSGKLDVSRLSKNVTSSNVFSKRKDNSNGNLCVYLLLDCSGSMYRTGDSELLTATTILHDMFNILGIKHRILAFSTNGYYCPSLSREFKKLNFIKEIGNNDYINLSLYDMYGFNRDGLAIGLVSALLRKENEENKALLILSDGLPNCDNYSRHRAIADTVKAIKDAKKDLKVTGIYFDKGDNKVEDMKKMYGQDYSTVRGKDSIIHAVNRAIVRALK